MTVEVLRNNGKLIVMTELLMLVFQETNAHMRNTEQKHLTISAAFLAATGLAFPVITASKSNSIEQSLSISLALFVLAIFGLIAHGLQEWFTMWKQHYVDVLKAQYVFMSQLDESKNHPIPQYLKTETKTIKVTGSADKLLNHVTLALSIVLGCCSFGYLINPILDIKNLKTQTSLIAALVLCYVCVFGYFFLVMRSYLVKRRQSLEV